MLGTFQQSTVRVQVAASGALLRRCLTEFALVRQWAWLQNFPTDLPATMSRGLVFDSFFGPVRLGHRIEQLDDDELHMVLWGGVDGHMRWQWGDGWLQSTVEGVSLIPLALGQTTLLDALTRFAEQLDRKAA
jgi:hypothetical protein